MPENHAARPGGPVDRARRHRRRLGRRRPGPAHRHAEPARAHPGVRGVRPRARRRGPHPRPRALEHRPGGRRRRLGRTPCAPADTVNGSHRGHHQFLAKVLAHLHPEGIDPTQPFPDDVRDALLRTPRRDLRPRPRLQPRPRRLACTCSGTRPARSAPTPSSAAASRSRPARRGRTGTRGTDDVAVTYFGDGAINIGSTLETFNLAGAWKLPICFFIENNQYAVSHARRRGDGRDAPVGPRPGLRHPELEGRRHGPARGPPRDAARRSQHMRAGGGPTLIEADVYRYFHQNGPFPGSAFRYRTKEEEAQPGAGATRSTRTARHLVRRGILDAGGRSTRVTAQAKALMAGARRGPARAEARRQAEERRIRPAEWPDPELRRRRHPRRPVASSTASRSPTSPTSTGRLDRGEVHRRRRRRHGPPHGDRPAHRRHGRGRAPPQRRHQRRDARA